MTTQKSAKSLSVRQAESILRQAVADPGTLKEKSHDLEDLLCESGRVFLPEQAHELLTEISYDLAFYQPNPKLRAEDASLIDSEHAVELIARTLAQLGDLD